METTLDLMCLTMVINDIDNVDIVSAMELAMSIYMTRCVLVCNCGFMFVFSGNYLLLVINSCSCKAFWFGCFLSQYINLLQQGLFCSLWFCLQCVMQHVHRTKAGSTFVWITTQARTNIFLILFRTLWRSVPGPLDAIFFSINHYSGKWLYVFVFLSLPESSCRFASWRPCLVETVLQNQKPVWLISYSAALHWAILNIRSLKRRYI